MHWRSIFRTISETYVDFALHSSIHGLKYTIDKKITLIERCFWIATVLLGLFGSSQMFLIFWNRHTGHPTRTTFETFFLPLNETPFPLITICTETAVIKSKLRRVLSKMDLIGYSEADVENAVLELFERYESNVNKTALIVLDEIFYKNKIWDATKFINSVIPDCKEFLVKCQWESKDFDCASRFQNDYIEHRRCCIFAERHTTDIYAFPKRFYNLYTQIDMGLTVVINFPGDDSLPEDASSAKIFINDVYDSNTRRSIVTRSAPGIILDLPFSATITESTNDVRLLNFEQRQCYFVDERTTGPFSFYTEATCKIESKWKETIDKCDCRSPFSFITDLFVCENVTSYPCTLHLEGEPIIEECTRTCNSIVYEVLESATPLLANESFLINPFYESFNITPQTGVLYIHHGTDLHIKLVKETITSTVYLLYSLGGVFSLFLGCSFVSLAEILYYIFLRLPIKMGTLRKVGCPNKQSEHHLYFSDFKINENVVSKSIKVKYRKEAFMQNKGML